MGKTTRTSSTLFTKTNIPDWLQPPIPPETDLFTERTFSTILELVANNESLKSICRRDNMPDSPVMLRRWIQEDPDRTKRFLEAQRVAAEHIVEEMVSIADAVDNQLEDVARSKLRIDTRKWIAEKWKPERYEPKQKIQSEHTINIVDAIEMASRRVERLRSPPARPALVIDNSTGEFDGG